MIKLNENGLVPAIAQNASTGEVLMLGYMSEGSLKRTLEGKVSGFIVEAEMIFGIKGRYQETTCM